MNRIVGFKSSNIFFHLLLFHLPLLLALSFCSSGDLRAESSPELEMQRKQSWSGHYPFAYLLNEEKSILYSDDGLKWPLGVVKKGNEILILNSFKTELSPIPETNLFGYFPASDGAMVLEVLVLGKFHGFMSAHDLYIKFEGERELTLEEREQLKSPLDKQREEQLILRNQEKLIKKRYSQAIRDELMIDEEELPRWIEERDRTKDYYFEKKIIDLSFRYFSLSGLRSKNSNLLTTKQGRLFSVALELWKRQESLNQLRFGLKGGPFHLRDSSSSLLAIGMEGGGIMLLRRVGPLKIYGEVSILFAPAWTSTIQERNRRVDGNLLGINLLIKNQWIIRQHYIWQFGLGHLYLKWPELSNGSIYLYASFGYKFD